MVGQFPHNAAEMAEIRRAVSKCCRLGVDFPEWPFDIRGNVLIYDFVEALNPDFGTVLASVAEHYSDDEIYVLGWDENSDRQDAEYRARYGAFPGFKMTSNRAEEDYRAAISVNQHAELGVYNVAQVVFDDVAIVGTSRRWAVRGQRCWDVAILVVDETPTFVPTVPQSGNLDVLMNPDWVIMDRNIPRSSWRRFRENCITQ